MSESENTDTGTDSVTDFTIPDYPDFGYIAPGENADGSPAPEPKTKTVAARPNTADDDKARSGAPTLDEWEKLFSKFIIRAATEWYLDFAFRNISEEELSAREIERLSLTDEERKRICVPFAELSNKSKFMRKHGRFIVSGAESIDSGMTLVFWFNRVNRIASKHRPPTGKARKESKNNVSSGQSTPESNGSGPYLQGQPVIIPGDG